MTSQRGRSFACLLSAREYLRYYPQDPLRTTAKACPVARHRPRRAPATLPTTTNHRLSHALGRQAGSGGELGALILENRLIKAWRPPGNVKLKRTDGYVFLRARLDIEYPVLEVAPEPAGGRAVNVGPLRGRSAAEELADQLASLFGLRHCGRSMRRRDHPSIYGQMDRCLSPCLGDLDPNLYRRRLDSALAPFEAGGDGGARLLEHIEERMREAAEAQRYERAAALLRRQERLTGLLGRLGGVLEAVHRSSRVVLARHPVKPRFDAVLIVAGRVVDWGPLPPVSELADRVRVALERSAARTRRVAVPPEEVDEVRIAAAWLAAHEPPELALEEAAEPAALGAFLRGAT